MKTTDEEDDDEEEETQPGDVVDAFGFNVSSRVQLGGAWTMRHTKILFLIYSIMKLCGISVKLEPRNMMNKLVPRPLRRDVEQERHRRKMRRALHGAIPDLAYEDPCDGRIKTVEVKVINNNWTRGPPQRGARGHHCYSVA
jgi:hypothetical protein